MLQRLLPVGYAWMVVQGLLAVFLPKQAIKLNAKLVLWGYENPGDLEPKGWYVRSTRITGLGMLVQADCGVGVDADVSIPGPDTRHPVDGHCADGRHSVDDTGDTALEVFALTAGDPQRDVDRCLDRGSRMERHRPAAGVEPAPVGAPSRARRRLVAVERPVQNRGSAAVDVS